MKILKQGVCLALLGAGLSAVPVTLATQAAATPSASAVADHNGLVRELRDSADGSLSIRTNKATGQAGFIRVTGAQADLLPGRAADSAASAADKAGAFVAKYGPLLGAAKGELVGQGVDATAQGWTVRYAQIHQGVPVFGSMVKANVDSDGDLTAVNGFAAPTAGVSTTPGISAAKVEQRALAFVRQDPPTNPDTGEAGDTSGVKASSDLVLYRTGFLRGATGATVLAYAVEVTNGANIRDQVILDATNGKLLNRYSMGTDALDRELIEASGTAENPIFTTVWQEGDPFPGALNVDQQNLVNSSGESYWFFENAFDRDSYDGAGAQRITVNNDPRINCPNANWNGQTTNYCDGVTSDDVVAHEWGHAYTEYTSGLIYQYQSGALNESYSDVWGETLDLINGREDEGETFGTKRADGECELTAPPGLDMAITAPAGVAGPCFGVAATGAKPFTTTPVTADVVVATDPADPAGPSTTDGCTAYTNAGAVSGNWSYVDRGGCTFALKVANAEAAGATGIVIGNNNVDPPGGFTGDPDLYGVMVTQADGTRFKTAGTVSVSVTAEDISAREDSTRWLMGEKSTAFGGAIRDMWTPTCYGDPGKVSDVEYKCDPLQTDAGGVHSNSGVPNHAYALTVDGGTYNGQTITGLGLDKAAAIWWRNQTAYLTPPSNFTEAADGLEASCADLVGDPIRVLTTETNATPVDAAPITSGDCAELTKVLNAVQMRSAVTKCNFQPLLAKNTPALCGPGFTTETVWKEDFEDGLAGWTPSFELFELGGNPYGGFHAPWAASTTAPGAHAGGVAYGPAPNDGQCTGDGVTDFSSRDSIASPATIIPTGTLQGLRLSFDHYVATEATYDGGNVKMSVNGGPFNVIPAAAYVFNKPGTLATLAQGSSDPLGGQEAFNGTDGGQARGSWGTSQVDLTAAGAKPGDSVRFRLDIGRDGCGGVDGWYVDNIQVTYCKVVSTPPATSFVKAKAEPKQIVKGRGFKAKVTVSTASGAAAGVVEIYKGDKLLGTGTLGANGKVTIKISKKKAKKLKIGKNTLTAKYLGSATVSAGQDDFVIKVRSKQ